jgi:hypothetical protein
MSKMTESAEPQQLIDWANGLLEEVLVKAARNLHESSDPSAPIEVAVTFQVTAQPDDGCLAVRSPGSRGRTINVGVPAPPAP